MSVTKYQRVEDMPAPLRVTGDGLLEKIRSAWNRARQLTPALDMPKGVRRFRSVEESGEARERAVLERMRDTSQ